MASIIFTAVIGDKARDAALTVLRREVEDAVRGGSDDEEYIGNLNDAIDALDNADPTNVIV